MILFVARFIGITMIIGCIIDAYLGEDWFKLSQNTRNLITIGNLIIGVFLSLLFEIKNIKEKIMGVDFFPCDYCSESICDCGSYERCECGRRWCSKDCAKKEGYLSDDDEYGRSCSYCRNEEAEDNELFHFLLNKYNLERDVVLKEYLEGKEDD